MVHFPPFASQELCIHSAMAGYCPAGLPHSEIPGSKPVCGSPRLIAAYHVLHRLSAPRHPPCTLSSLTNTLNPLLYPANPIASYPIQLSKNKTLSGVHANLENSRLPRIPEDRTTLRSWSQIPKRQAGGADRVRTDDLRLARAALSQLSYSPDSSIRAHPASGGPR
jgi:hypothetical protein